MQIKNVEAKRQACIKAGSIRKYDPYLLGEEMIEWSKEEDSINLCEFCADRGYSLNLIKRLQKEVPEFNNYIEIVKMQIAERRERYLNEGRLSVKAWDRCARMYDLFLDDHETQLEDRDAERKHGISNNNQLNLVMLAKMAAEGTISQKD